MIDFKNDDVWMKLMWLRKRYLPRKNYLFIIPESSEYLDHIKESMGYKDWFTCLHYDFSYLLISICNLSPYDRRTLDCLLSDHVKNPAKYKNWYNQDPQADAYCRGLVGSVENILKIGYRAYLEDIFFYLLEAIEVPETFKSEFYQLIDLSQYEAECI